ncbi:MAG: class I SAM-dependent methyltransferase [Halothece sp.]
MNFVETLYATSLHQTVKCFIKHTVLLIIIQLRSDRHLPIKTFNATKNIMESLSIISCLVCQKTELTPFFEINNLPIYCNLLWSNKNSAINCVKGDIKLGFCSECGFIYNLAFDSEKINYSESYENSLHYSRRFQDYANRLAKDLIDRHNLNHKSIIEIGCGKGDFLVTLSELGYNKGIGFDPSYIPREEHNFGSDRIQFIQDFYSEKYQQYSSDLIVCRHTLEHISQPIEHLLKPLRKAIGDRLNTILFFEVPDAIHTFQNLAIWDIIYEHCSYFSSPSLKTASHLSGFKVTGIKNTFENQFLCLEALPSDPNATPDPQIAEEVAHLKVNINNFTAKFNQLIEKWNKKLENLAQTNQKVVTWGAGSKGVTFLNLLNNQHIIDYIVDLNPRKQGKYVPGTGQKIVSPDFLLEYSPDIVIVMNPIYQEEIFQLTQGLNLHCEVTSV